MCEIQRLRKENRQLVQQNLDLGETNELLEQIFQSLKNDWRGQEIIRRLKRGEDHQSIAAWLGQPLILDSGQVASTSVQPLVGPVAGYKHDCADDQSLWDWADLSNQRVLYDRLATLAPMNSNIPYPA